MRARRGGGARNCHRCAWFCRRRCRLHGQRRTHHARLQAAIQLEPDLDAHRQRDGHDGHDTHYEGEEARVALAIQVHLRAACEQAGSAGAVSCRAGGRQLSRLRAFAPLGSRERALSSSATKRKAQRLSCAIVFRKFKSSLANGRMRRLASSITNASRKPTTTACARVGAAGSSHATVNNVNEATGPRAARKPPHTPWPAEPGAMSARMEVSASFRMSSTASQYLK